MAIRVFELAKELSVKSAAIVEKCKAEGIPNVTNHMSSLSAGLEATVREWFSVSDGGTAIETAERVDLDKVRVKPKRRASTRSTEAAAAKDGSDSDEDDSGGGVATLEAQPDEVSVKDKAATVARPASRKAPTSVESNDLVEPDVEETPTKKPVTEDKKSADLRPAATAAPPAAPTGTDGDTTVETPEDEQSRAAPMNVPERPRVVKPAGPRLEVQKPAKLSGPKVVRVEAPEVVEPRRQRRTAEEPEIPVSRGPRGGSGAGTSDRAEDERTDRRNKRRSTTSGRSRRGTTQSNAEPGAWREQDLIEREARLSRSEGFLRQRRRDQKLKQQATRDRSQAGAASGPVKVASPIVIKDLSSATGVKAAEVIKRLFLKGVMATPNSVIDDEQAQEIMIDFDIELDIVTQQTAQQAVEQEFERREAVEVLPRSPVVTILGHVDHGKTSLLDRIRNANVAAGEAGGITQATSAFRVPVRTGDDEKFICFLDTPGHEAFTEMRARGANMTDIVVLVVAADDGVMPQTIESINHAKAAGVPIVVALNKIDLPGATEERIRRIHSQLAEHGLNPVEWGGDTEVVKTSATTGQGVQDLLEVLDYQAQLLNLSADSKGPASGVVVESRLEEGRGSVANLLIQQGELRVGDFIVCGRAFGRVRDITNDRGERVKTAGPATPVQISGIDEVPDAGDKFYIVKDLKNAQNAAEQRRQFEREQALAQPKLTLDRMFAQMEEAEVKELTVIVKADVQGSVDVIRSAVQQLSTESVKIRVVHAAVGGVTDSDISLAATTGAVVLGFNVIPSSKARLAAEQKGVEIRAYRVIYEILDDMKKAAEGMLEPELREEVLGHADVRRVFKVSKVGAVAGCYVTDGTIERNALIRVTRQDIVIEHDRVLEQLKRFKDDVKEVRAGQECGMKIQGYDDIKEGDILECYRKVEVKRTL